jgi:hypothetical protein
VLVLRGEDALFGESVILKCAVTVKMVGSDVEDDGDLWMEALSALELEA